MTAPEITDRLPISIRAYAERLTNKPKRKPNRYAAKPVAPASLHSLTFDCETTTDSAQSLRFGTYQHRYNGELKESGIFYANDTLSGDEIGMLRNYAARNNLECLTRDTFVKEKFYKIGYDWRGMIIGFNLPFDISRLAIGHGPSKKGMVGGFSFTLSDDKRPPLVRVKHVSARAAFIDFAAPFANQTTRSQRKRGEIEPPYRGNFLDCKTLASALLAKLYNLGDLGKTLRIGSQKLGAPKFDGPITNEFIDYALRDTQATWECYEALISKFDDLALSDTVAPKIYSEASLGKAGLKSMGIKSWQQCQPDFDPQIIGYIMASYFGGRSEIGIRRSERQVMLCDFLSMYPTVCTLMNLWQFVIAEGVKTNEAADEARQILAGVQLSDLQSKAFWSKLTMIARVKPDADIFPVRAHYNRAAQPTIGLNYLTNDGGQWFTLADCIAAKLLTGKAPLVLEAISFAPMGKQKGMASFKVNGEDAYTIDPATDDYYKRLIELRQATKARMKGASEADKADLETQQNSLKIMANATSYGAFVEFNVEDAKAGTRSRVYNGSASPFNMQAKKIENPGSFFHPLLATLITGSARLMLAITERLATDKGLDWSFCDTDSMALAKPNNLNSSELAAHKQSIIDWFGELNPYCFEGSILKSEDVNYSLSGNGELEPLYCFAVSAKRYALYNLDSNKRPIIRKASAHGLGHLRAPYDETNPAKNIPKPQIDLAKAGLALWQHDLWFGIIEASKTDAPLMVNLDYHSALQLPAIGRYSATSPHLLRWFKKHNAERAYVDQVKPFGFLTPMTADNFIADETIIEQPSKKGKSKSPLKPIAPFTTNPAIAGQTAFDRNTGEGIPARLLKSYAAAIRQYHLQPENKFLNGNYIESGKTMRRHVKAERTMHIGKEANDLERQTTLGYDHAAQPAYGYCPDDIAELQREIKRLCSVFSISQLAQYGEITTKRIADFINANSNSKIASDDAITIEATRSHFSDLERKQQLRLDQFDKMVAKYGLRKTGKALGMDASNLRRVLSSRE